MQFLVLYCLTLSSSYVIHLNCLCLEDYLSHFEKEVLYGASFHIEHEAIWLEASTNLSTKPIKYVHRFGKYSRLSKDRPVLLVLQSQDFPLSMEA